MQKPKILVVDNNPRHRQSLGRVLESADYEVVQAEGRDQARQILANELIHLAIIDIRLINEEDDNDESGLELCREIDFTVARILMTAFERPQTVKKALEIAGDKRPIANGYLQKQEDESLYVVPEVRRVLREQFEVIPRDRFAILTSGGDSPGMNAAVWAVVRAAMAKEIEVIGIEDGYRGLIEGRLHKLRWSEMTEHMTRSGTVLGSARCPDFKDPEARRSAVDNLLKAHVSGLIVIGGDGSIQGAKALADDIAQAGRRLKTVALPGTIDNDLYGTDMSLGAASAANAIVNELKNMVPPARAMRRIFICEVMGRYTGFLALEAGVCFGADAILIPEQVIHTGANGEILMKRSRDELTRRIDEIADRLRCTFEDRQRHALVVISEGIGKLIQRDREWVRERLQENIDLWPKELQPDVRTQVLGYLVRGVPPGRFDLSLGIALGGAAVDALLEGLSHVMIGWSYKEGIQEIDFDEVVKKSAMLPSETLANRPRWKQLLRIHETMVSPPCSSVLRDPAP